METEARYTFVGLVLVLGLVAVGASLWWLAADERGTREDLYVSYFKEQSLSGLQINSNVTMKGIKVGRVTGFKISEANIELVKVDLALEIGTPVKTDTRAVIQRNLLTGLAQVDLTGGTQESPLLLMGNSREEAPVIKEGRGELEAIADTLPELLDSTAQLVKKASLFFTPENGEHITQILANLEAMTSSLNESTKTLQGAIEGVELLAQTTSDAANSIEMLAKTTEGSIRELEENASDALGEVGSSAKAFRQDLEQSSRSWQAALLNISTKWSEVANRLVEASSSVARTARTVENPREILVGPNEASLGPGE